jgi:hypothetical protein
VSVQSHDFERWAALMDRQACDDSLTAEEQAFCRDFESAHPVATHELTSYEELADLQAAPNTDTRSLVDRALKQIEAEDAARALDEVRLLRRPRVPSWLAVAGSFAVAAAAAFALHAARTPEAKQMPVAAQSGDVQNTPRPLARAELVYTSGVVKVSGANAQAGRTLLAEGSSVETDGGGACVLIDSDINVCLAAHSRMRLRAITSPAREIDLELGKLATRLSTQPEGMSLSIVADGVTSTAVGTAFSVEQSGDTGVITTVLNGRVRVARKGAAPASSGALDNLHRHNDGRAVDDANAQIVNAHERAASGSRGMSVTSVSRTQEAPSWALLGPTVLWHDPVAATLDVHGEPAGAETWLDDQWIGIAPLSSLIPVGKHRLSVRKGGVTLTTRELHVQAGESEEVSYAALAYAPETTAETVAAGAAATSGTSNLNLGKHPAAAHGGHASALQAHETRELKAKAQNEAPSDASASASELLRLARQSVRAGRYADAGATYQSLLHSYSGSDEAQTALVLLGQLRLNQLNDPKGALEPLNSYLQHGGSLEVEARVSRIEALHELQRNADERVAIDEFLRRHPRSFEAQGMRARLSSLRASP